MNRQQLVEANHALNLMDHVAKHVFSNPSNRLGDLRLNSTGSPRVPLTESDVALVLKTLVDKASAQLQEAGITYSLPEKL